MGGLRDFTSWCGDPGGSLQSDGYQCTPGKNGVRVQPLTFQHLQLVKPVSFLVGPARTLQRNHIKRLDSNHFIG